MADAADGGVAWESSPSALVADSESGRGLRSGFCLCTLVVVDMKNEHEKFQQLVSTVAQKYSVYTVFHEVRITVKPVFFACPLFCDPDEFAKITGRKYIF